MLESKPAIINLYLQVSCLQEFNLPYNNQAAYLLPDAIKPTHCFPGQTRVRGPVLRKGSSLTKRGTYPYKSKMCILCYSLEL